MLDIRQMGGPQAEQPKQPPIAEFEGYVECPLFSEECKITLEKDGLTIAGRFHQLPILYGEIRAIKAGEYRLELDTAGGGVAFSRMGPQLQWLSDKLTDAFNDAVAGALLAEGEPAMAARCGYSAREGESSHQGEAAVQLYEDCLLLLPPNENARRLPLCWISGLDKQDYALKLTLASGERYTLSKMGRDLDELDRQMTAKLRALREQTLEWHKKLAPTLGSMQSAASGSLMPLGRAADFGKLAQTAPPLASSLEEKAGRSRMADTFPWLRELCGGEGLMLGAIPAPEQAEGGASPTAMLQGVDLGSILNGSSPSGETDEQTEEAPAEPLPILWLMAPDREKSVAAVELALADNEAAATYLYHIEGDWEAFSRTIDRALEAAGFQRETILLSEDKLALPEHIRDAMLLKRTPALQTLRRCFVGRAIHSSQERWRRDIEKCREEAAKARQPAEPMQEQAHAPKFCPGCGARLTPGVKFCGQCGAKLN